MKEENASSPSEDVLPEGNPAPTADTPEGDEPNRTNNAVHNSVDVSGSS